MSEDHTDPGELEGLASPPLMLTMSDDEPAAMCSRARDLDAALAAGIAPRSRANRRGLSSLRETVCNGPGAIASAEVQNLGDRGSRHDRQVTSSARAGYRRPCRMRGSGRTSRPAGSGGPSRPRRTGRPAGSGGPSRRALDLVRCHHQASGLTKPHNALVFRYLRPQDQKRYYRGFCTGFAAYYTSAIWTNAHCIDGAQEILVDWADLDVELFVVRAGTRFRRAGTYPILDRMWKHPDYDGTTRSEDVGLIDIDGTVPTVLNLLPRDMAESLVIGQPLGTLGFPGELGVTGGDAGGMAIPTFKDGDAQRASAHRWR